MSGALPPAEDRAVAASPSSPQAVSPVPASIPSADTYTTVVVKHTDAAAAQAFIQFAHAHWPFLPNDAAPTQMTAISIGDALSVQEAMRSALECEELSRDERTEFALDLDANCYTWSECLAYAEKEWELAYRDGQFVDLPDAQGTEAGTAETEGLGPKDDGPVAESDAPNLSHPLNTKGDN